MFLNTFALRQEAAGAERVKKKIYEFHHFVCTSSSCLSLLYLQYIQQMVCLGPCQLIMQARVAYPARTFTCPRRTDSTCTFSSPDFSFHSIKQLCILPIPPPPPPPQQFAKLPFEIAGAHFYSCVTQGTTQTPQQASV